MQDSVIEYKVLASLFDPKHYEQIHKLPDHWFTDSRISLLKSMRNAYTDFGYITPEATEVYYKQQLPEEIFIPVISELDPLYRELYRLSKKRKLHEGSIRLKELSEKHDPNLLEIDFSDLDDTEYDTSLTLASTELLGSITRKRTGQYKFLNTGYNFLNSMMGLEWERKAVSILMANPGCGKSALMCNSALRMADPTLMTYIDNQPKEPIESLIFSLEMDKASLIGRMAADLGNIDFEQIKTGNLTDEEYEYVQEVTERLNQLPIRIIDNSTMSIHNIVAVIREYAKKGVKVFFIDHLQIIKLDSDDKNAELGRITTKLKNLAKKYDIHICILSQKNGKESVWQVRNSGDVPANVDIIIDMKVQEDSEVGGIKTIDIEFVKNRNGRTGKAPIQYDGRYLRFINR